MVPEDAAFIGVEDCVELVDNDAGFIFHTHVRDKGRHDGWGYTFFRAKEGMEDTQAHVE